MTRLILPSLLAFTLVATSSRGQVSTPTFDKAGLAWTLPWDVDWVTAVSFVGPTRVAAGNNLGEILVWEIPDKAAGPAPAPLRRLEGHTNVITRLLSTPDGRWLISASNDRTIRFWDMQAPSKKTETYVLNTRPRDEAEARKKKAPAPVEVKVEVCDSTHTLSGHKDWVLGLSLSRDGNFMLSGDDKGEVVLWDRPAMKEIRRWKVKGWAWALALSPEGDAALVSERFPLVFDSGRHGGIKLWDAKTGEMRRDLGKETKEFDKQMYAAAAFSADGKWLAIGRGGEIDGLNGKVTLLDPSGKKLRELMPGHLNGITDLAFHPDGKHLFSCGRDTTVRVWRLEDGKLVKELGQARGGQFKDWIHAVSPSPDGKWVAAADMAGMVHVYALNGVSK